MFGWKTTTKGEENTKQAVHHQLEPQHHQQQQQQHHGGDICQVPFTHKTKDKSIVTKTMHHIRDYKTAVKHGRMLKPYSYTERKVREATRNTSWGPHGGQLVEIAQLSYRHQECGTIFNVLEERFQCPPEKWRNVSKALCVLEYLVQRGSEEALTWASSEPIQNTLGRLEGFSYVTADTEQRDVGAVVRQRARSVHELLLNEEKLRDVRKKGAIQSMRMAGICIDTTAETATEMEQRHSVSSDTDAGETVVGAHACVQHERTLSRESTKGVSEEDNARHIEALKYLLDRPENAVCADCGMKGTGCRPTWASISLGVFMCLRCAGIHRSLGVNISQVRSCSLDVWAYSQVEFMARCGGNSHANGYWEHGLETKPRILTIGNLENFIRDKYVEKKYCNDAEVWPPVDDTYIEEEVWCVLKGAMNEQQLADFECRQEVQDGDDSSKEEVSLIDLLDGDEHGSYLIGDQTGVAIHDDPFGCIDVHGIAQHDTRPDTSARDMLAGLQWDASFAGGTVNASVDKGTEKSSLSGAFRNEAFADVETDMAQQNLNDTLEYLGLGREKEKGEATMGHIPPSLAMQRGEQEAPVLKPQEKKAQDLLVGALQDFDLAAGIASVSPKALYSGTLSSKDRGCPMVKK